MDRSDLSILAAFLAIPEERSFTKAAKRLSVSPSGMSHAIRGLEETLGVRLLSRTTRSVAPTEAGEQLLARLRPALTDVQDALDQLSDFLAEQPVDVGAGHFGVFDDVVQQGGDDGGGVEPIVREYTRDFDRVSEIGVAGGALL